MRYRVQKTMELMSIHVEADQLTFWVRELDAPTGDKGLPVRVAVTESYPRMIKPQTKLTLTLEIDA